ncbi:MAG: PAS domain S-box protein [Proteobacteria bacterium]|nr:PAS domain S-box protein [Pseudomonadota bacterium]
MESAVPLVRIAVAQPSAPAGVATDTLHALRRLGGEVELELVRDAAGCLAATERAEIDLVVVDSDLGPGVSEILSALRESGPPVVVVRRDAREEAALEAFRRGAADCVRVGHDYADVLPVVALEQIRRWRAVRERGDAERRIRWLERLNDAIVTEIPAALAVLDGDGCVVAVNPEFTRALGVSAREAQGRPLERVFPGDLVASGQLSDLLTRAASGEPSGPRLARMRTSDDERVFDVRGQPLDEEGRLLLVLSDVTEREKLARRIRERQRYNENIIQNMNSALVVVDLEGRITVSNPRAEAILGVDRVGLEGRSIYDWLSDLPPAHTQIARTLARGTSFKGAETLITRPDGSVLPIAISCASLVDAEGTRLGAVAIFQDQSEIKQLQRQVLQTEKMASIGQLAAGVAHEINNPTGFIHANLFQMSEYLTDLRRVWEHVESLQKAASGGDPAAIAHEAQALAARVREVDLEFVLTDFAKAVRESQEGSERIRHIVQDLRDFSRQDTSERVQADINQCVDSTANIVWTMMKHSVVLKKEYRDLPPVYCYPMQLKQVFMNLLVNAYQAIEEQRADESHVGEIQLQTECSRGGVVVRVSDTGAGISPQDLDRIFDPFFTTKEVGAGTGLGLSTSYSIVQRHGGTVRVESQVGVGTCFEVWLPLGEDTELEVSA